MGKYDNQIIDTGGYDNAIKYYQDLKEYFIEQYETQATATDMQKGSEWANTIETAYSNAIQQFGPDAGKSSFEILNSIYEKFAISDDVNKLRNALLNSITEEEQKNLGQDQKLRNEHKAEIRQLLNSANVSNILQSSMLAAINATPGIEAIALEELVKSANQLFMVSYSAALQQIQEHVLRGKVAVTRQGYIRESLELGALKKAVQNTPIIATHGGSKKVDNKETAFDNILSFINFNEASFSQQVQYSKNIDLAQDFKSIFQNFQYFGEQVKSFNLMASQAKSYMHRITGNEQLKNALLSETQSSYITLTQNLRFMARANNIIQALGPATILYSTGAGRQWTSNFIETFRSQGYYLGFEYDNQPGRITSDIALMSPWKINAKTGRTIKRTSKAFKNARTR